MVNGNPRVGLIELNTFDKFGYQKRSIVLGFLVKSVVTGVLPHLRHNIRLQGEDFALALDLLEDDIQRYGPLPPLVAATGDGSDAAPPRQTDQDHPEWVLAQGRALCL